MLSVCFGGSPTAITSCKTCPLRSLGRNPTTWESTVLPDPEPRMDRSRGPRVTPAAWGANQGVQWSRTCSCVLKKVGRGLLGRWGGRQAAIPGCLTGENNFHAVICDTSSVARAGFEAAPATPGACPGRPRPQLSDTKRGKKERGPSRQSSLRTPHFSDIVLKSRTSAS